MHEPSHVIISHSLNCIRSTRICIHGTDMTSVPVKISVPCHGTYVPANGIYIPADGTENLSAKKMSTLRTTLATFTHRSA